MVAFLVKGSASQDIVAWAYAELEEGRDTPNLRILAGLRSPLDWGVVEHYFGATLRERGWEVEDGKPFLRHYIVEITREILAGARNPVTASQDIYALYQQLDYPIDLSNWLYITDGLDPDTHKEISRESLNRAILREAQRTL